MGSFSELPYGIPSHDTFGISSIEPDVGQFRKAIRCHREIENKVHRISDAVFREDACRIRKGSASENLAVIRHIALNLLRNEQSLKIRRYRAGGDNDCLLKVLKAV